MARKPRPMHHSHPEGQFYGQTPPPEPEAAARDALRHSKLYPGDAAAANKQATKKIQKTFGRG